MTAWWPSRWSVIEGSALDEADLTCIERQMAEASSQFEKINHQMSDVDSKATVDHE